MATRMMSDNSPGWSTERTPAGVLFRFRTDRKIHPCSV